MKYEIFPIISIYDLESEMVAQFGDDFRDLRQLMFGDNYMNDVYCSYSYDEMEEYTGKSWQNEEHIRMENCIKAFLRDTFPKYTRVMVDVSW